MAMPPPRSSSRRAGFPRWLVLPFLLTIIALLADASVHARSPKLQAALSNSAWVDQVLPYIVNSTAQGREIAQLSSAALPAGAGAASKQLDTVANAAASTYRSVVATDPSGQVAAVAGLLQACLDARSQGAAEMASAVRALLRGGTTKAAVAQMTSAVADFEVGDNAYRLFTADMPKLGASLPSSRWVNSGSYQPSALLSFADRLLAARPKAPTQPLALDAVSTTPAVLSLQGKVDILAPASSFSVTAVVADTGPTPLRGVRVTAVVAPARGSSPQQVSATVDLAPGQATAVTVHGLQPPLSTPATLTVSASAPGTTGQNVSKQLEVELPGPNFKGAPATTTTAPSATTTPPAASTTTASTTRTPTTTAPSATTTGASPAATTTLPAATTTSTLTATASTT